MRTASLIALPPSAEEMSIRSAIGPRQSGPASSPVEPEHDAEQAADVAGVAVGVPARGVDDRLRPREVVGRVEHGHDHQRVVRHDVAVARIPVVAVAVLDQLPGRRPVRVGPVPAANVADQPGDQAIGRDLREPDREQVVDVGRSERLGLHRGPEHGGMHRLAVMADAGGAAGEPCGEAGLAGRHHRPAVDEDLRPDLFGEGRAVHRDRSALRRRDALAQVEPGGVLGGIAVAAPPQDRSLLDEVVEPGAADVARAEVRRDAVVLEGADEGEGAGHVVVGDHERLAEPLVDVVLDRAELAHDPLVGPSLERPPEIDPDQLAQHPGIDALEVVLGDRHSPSSSVRAALPAKGRPGASLSRGAGGRNLGSGPRAPKPSC